MPVWLSICVALYPPLTGVSVLLWRLGTKVASMGQHFDEDSPVGQAVGTVPGRLAELEQLKPLLPHVDELQDLVA